MDSEKPFVRGWSVNKCDRRDWDNTELLKDALERLYVAVSPGRNRSIVLMDTRTVEERDRLTRLIDELSVALVGGVPEGWEEYT